jgi:hypothetical protein
LSCLASLMQTVRKATIMTRFLAPTETRSSGFQKPVNFPPPAKYKFIFGQSERHHQIKIQASPAHVTTLSRPHTSSLSAAVPRPSTGSAHLSVLQVTILTGLCILLTHKTHRYAVLSFFTRSRPVTLSQLQTAPTYTPSARIPLEVPRYVTF